MEIESTPQQVPHAPALANKGVDPTSDLCLQMRVIGEGRKALGTLDALEYDSNSGRLTVLAVRHGLYNQRLTFVPADNVDTVTPGVLVLQISKAAFMQLPRLENDHPYEADDSLRLSGSEHAINSTEPSVTVTEIEDAT